MAIGKEMKKLLGKSQRTEAYTSMDPTELTAGGVDLSLVMDGLSLSQDFGLWFGKSIFESTLAEVIHKEHSGHTAITLMDVLELMVAVYCPNVAGVHKEQMNPRQTHEAFYRSIHDRRCDMSDADWEIFRQRLSFEIAKNCDRLRNEKVPELHGISSSASSEDSVVSTPTINASSRASSSSSLNSSPALLHQQHSAESLSEANRIAQSQPALQSVANPVLTPRVAVNMYRYTSALNEHAAREGERLTYEKEQLSLSPSSWQCTATFGDISRLGKGRNSTKAKHEASKQICELLDLVVR